MIESEFEDAEGAKAIGFSHGDFGLVVQAFHNAAGNQLLSPEVIEDQLPVLTEGARELLHGLNAGSHGLAAPPVEKLAGPGGRVVIPELLRGFLEKVSPDGPQVVAEELAEPEVLFVTEILLNRFRSVAQEPKVLPQKAKKIPAAPKNLNACV